MFSSNRMGGGFLPHQTRQFSTTSNKGPLFNGMPSSTGYLDKVDWHSISSQKKFENPNFVIKSNPSIHSCPPTFNLQTSNTPLRDICSDFYKATTTNFQVKSFSTEPIAIKENTQRKKQHVPNIKKSRDHHSPRKAHKNKMNIDIKYEIDEVGVDCLSDQFESDSNDTPTIDQQSPPVFIHEALPDVEIKSEVCRISSSPICIAIGTPEQSFVMVTSIGENIVRRRLSSECSEDSFVVFQYDDDDISVTESFVESDDEDSCSEYSEDDDSYIQKTDVDDSKEACSKVVKQVTFAKDLCTVCPMIAWSFAYQAARKGPWEQCARDRGRFKDRIEKTEEILRPILQDDHRRRIYHERKRFKEQDGKEIEKKIDSKDMLTSPISDSQIP